MNNLLDFDNIARDAIEPKIPRAYGEDNIKHHLFYVNGDPLHILSECNPAKIRQMVSEYIEGKSDEYIMGLALIGSNSKNEVVSIYKMDANRKWDCASLGHRYLRLIKHRIDMIEASNDE